MTLQPLWNKRKNILKVAHLFFDTLTNTKIYYPYIY